MTDAQVIKDLTNTVNALLNGEEVSEELPGELNLPGTVSNELKELHKCISVLTAKHREASQFMLKLSQGSLEQDPPKQNFLISPFKDLHSSLRHLIWQTQRIAEGDYNQHINFMGDFSTSFNRMIETLKEKRAAEIALQESEKRARLFLENATDTIFLIDPEMNLFYISPSCINILGYSDTERMTLPLTEIYTVDEINNQKNIIRKNIEHYNLTGENINITFENQGRHKDGHWVWVETTLRLLLDNEGMIMGIQGGARDITDRMMAQEALHSQNQDLIDLNATKDKFFSIIAHDLRGPVGSMHSLLELISEPEIQLDEEKHLELLNVMKEVSKTTFNLLENLLIWANSQRGSIEFSPKYYDLHKLVELNISLFRQVTLNKQISVINHVKTGCVRFFDYNMINTVIRNLVNNAIKFSHTNGKISVSAVETPGYLKVTVKDSGTGMKPSTIDQLFKIDTVSKSMKGTNGESGTGLGLLLCKEFVLKHSGDIMVESEPEKGSSFSFTIPNKLLV